MSNDVGKIRLINAAITGESKVKSSTGSIELEITHMDSEGDLYVNTDIGSIKATLAESLNCDLQTSADVGDIHGVARGKSSWGTGGPLLTLDTSVGSITVE